MNESWKCWWIEGLCRDDVGVFELMSRSCCSAQTWTSVRRTCVRRSVWTRREVSAATVMGDRGRDWDETSGAVR